MGRSCGNCCEPLEPTCPNCLTCAGYEYTLCSDTRNPASGIGCSRREEDDPVIRLLNRSQILFAQRTRSCAKWGYIGSGSQTIVPGDPYWGIWNDYYGGMTLPTEEGRHYLIPGTHISFDSGLDSGQNFETHWGGPALFAQVTGQDFTAEQYKLWERGQAHGLKGWPPEHMCGVYDSWDGYGDGLSVQLVLEDIQEDADCGDLSHSKNDQGGESNCLQHRDALCYRPPPMGYGVRGGTTQEGRAYVGRHFLVSYVANSQFSPSTSNPSGVHSFYFYHTQTITTFNQRAGANIETPYTLRLWGHRNQKLTEWGNNRFFSRYNWDAYPYNINPVYDNRERSTWWMQPSSDNNLFGSKNLNVRGCDRGSTGEVRLYTDGDQAKKNSSCSYNAGPFDPNWDAPHWLRWKRILARQLLLEQLGTCWYDFDDILNLDGKYFWLLDENHDEYHVWFRWYQNNTSDPNPSGSSGGYEVILYPDATTFRQHHPEQKSSAIINLYREVYYNPNMVSGEIHYGLPSGQYADDPDAPGPARFSKQPYYWDWWNLGVPPYKLLQDLNNAQSGPRRMGLPEYLDNRLRQGHIGRFIRQNPSGLASDTVEGNNWEIVMPTLLLSACIKYFLHDSLDDADRKWTIDIDGRVLNHRNRFPLELQPWGTQKNTPGAGSLYQETQWSFLDISTIKKTSGEGLMCYMSDGNSGLAFENNRDNDFYIGGGNCCGGYPQYGHNARLFVTIPCCHCDTTGTWKQRYISHTEMAPWPHYGRIIGTWNREAGGHFENLTYNITKPQCGPNDPPCLCHNASIHGRLGDGTTPDGVGKHVYAGTYGDVWYDLHEYRTDKFNCYKCNEFTLEKSTGHSQCDRSHNLTLPDKLSICPKEECRDNLIVVVINDVDTVYGHEDRALASKVWDFDKQLFDSIDYDFNVIYIQPRPHGNYVTLPWYSNNVNLISAGSWPSRIHYKPVDHCNELGWCKKPSDLGTDYPYQHNWEAGCLRVTWDDIVTSINAVSRGRSPDHVHFMIDETVWANIALHPPQWQPAPEPQGRGAGAAGSGVNNLVYSKRICFDPPLGGTPPTPTTDGTGNWDHENCYKYEQCRTSMDERDVGWDTTIWSGFRSLIEAGERGGRQRNIDLSRKFGDILPNREGKFCNEGFSVSISPGYTGAASPAQRSGKPSNRWMGLLVDYLLSRQIGMYRGDWLRRFTAGGDWENNWSWWSCGHGHSPMATGGYWYGDHFGASGDRPNDGHGAAPVAYSPTGHIPASDMVTPEGCGWWSCTCLPVGLCPRTEPGISDVGFSCYDLKRADMGILDWRGGSEGWEDNHYHPVQLDPENHPDVGCWQHRGRRPWKHVGGGTGTLEHRLVGGQIIAGNWGPWYGVAQSNRHHTHGCFTDWRGIGIWGYTELDAPAGSGWCMPENPSESIECYSRRKLNSLAAVKDAMFTGHTYWSHNWNRGGGNACPCNVADITDEYGNRNYSVDHTCIGQDNLMIPWGYPRRSSMGLDWWWLGGWMGVMSGRSGMVGDYFLPWCSRQKTMYEYNTVYENMAFWKLLSDEYSGNDELVSGGGYYYGHKRICEQCVCPEVQNRRWQVDAPDTGARCSWGGNNFALGGTYILDYYWQSTKAHTVAGITTSGFGWHWGGQGGTGYGEIAGIDEDNRAFTKTGTNSSGEDYGVSVPMWNTGFTHTRPWNPNSNYGFVVTAGGCKWVLHGTNTWWDRVEFTMSDGGGPGYWNMHPNWSMNFLNYEANQNWFGVLTFFNGKHEPIMSYGFTGHKKMDIVYPIDYWNPNTPKRGLIYRGCDLENIGTITSQFREMHKPVGGGWGSGGTGAACGPSCRRTITPKDAGTKTRQDKGLMPEADPLNPNAIPYPYTYRFEDCNMWDWMPETITMTLL